MHCFIASVSPVDHVPFLVEIPCWEVRFWISSFMVFCIWFNILKLLTFLIFSSISSKAAAIHRYRSFEFFQYFTLFKYFPICEFRFSIQLVVAKLLEKSTFNPNLCRVKISSRPSSRDLAANKLITSRSRFKSFRDSLASLGTAQYLNDFYRS